ncbi:MAG: alpha/beta hydrolase [Proteobacteria bacterium]|nr:alpha/beta hydrolase [Pseudomonadota bacterium]
MALQESDIEFNGIPIHIWEGGEGFPIVVMHGSGAGASIIGNFGRVLEPLTKRYKILAADLVGFGLSGRRPHEPYFDMDMWVDQADFLAQRLSKGGVGFIGHSLSGAIGLKLAARTARISKLLTTGTMGVQFEADGSSGGWRYPETRDALKRYMETTVLDPKCIKDDDVMYRLKLLAQHGYKDYFTKMFRMPRQHYIDLSVVSERELASIKCDVMLMSGANDKGFTPENSSLALAAALPQADIAIFNRCAHSVAFEYPAKFLRVCQAFFG